MLSQNIKKEINRKGKKEEVERGRKGWDTLYF